MDLKYVKGSYMDEIMFEGKPVLFTLEGLEEGREDEARRYSQEIWDWVLAHRSRVMAHAPLIANLKNKKWRSEGEPEVTSDEIRSYLQRINSVYVTYKGGFDVFFDTNDVFHERSVVVSMGKNFVFEGVKLL
ncbi:hypothetical protein [uncultured Megasphaera sp.]|uniref:hypothetical protein n=1 Tax=uncultured Megasphaera sp. TaxID=165188 RepID=UPI002657E95C|nr:hypothetical protein [uncultured Megasphaera sp.]